MRANQTTIPSEVVSVLTAAEIEGNALRLTGQLDRKTYTAVNDVLTRFGGKWNKSKKAHIFDGVEDVKGAIAEACETGEMPRKNELAYWPTPEPVVNYLMELAAPLPAKGRWLEPSAGEGAIVRGMLTAGVPIGCITAYEIDPGRCAKLREFSVPSACADFLTYEPGGPYERIVMNPPFAIPGNSAVYVDHIERAWSQLAEGGRLVAVAPLGLCFSNVSRVRALRELIYGVGHIEELDADAFKHSGTMVRTVVAVMQK